MVLPYLKGSSLYILVLFMVNVWMSLIFKDIVLKFMAIFSIRYTKGFFW
jgi:hypothetical protein